MAAGPCHRGAGRASGRCAGSSHRSASADGRLICSITDVGGLVKKLTMLLGFSVVIAAGHKHTEVL